MLWVAYGLVAVALYPLYVRHVARYRRDAHPQLAIDGTDVGFITPFSTAAAAFWPVTLVLGGFWLATRFIISIDEEGE